MCEICGVIGKSEITPQAGVRLEEWVDDFDHESPIRDRIRKNITYYLGNGVKTRLLSEAAERLFNRDYKNKKQIIVPEFFISKNPAMLFTEKEELEKRLENPNLSTQDKLKWKSRLKTISGEPSEKNLYDCLRNYFANNDQTILVLHGYKIMSLKMLLDKKGKEYIGNWEKDCVIINLTYGYILTIEAKNTLSPADIKDAKKQLLNTKEMLEKWFGANLKQKWNFFSAIYCEKGDQYNNLCKECNFDFVFAGAKDFISKLEKLHKVPKQPEEQDLESFQLMATYLLFLSTYAPVPVASVIDMEIVTSIEKSGDGKNIAFWNWTPEQKSLLDSFIPRAIFTSYWSTGKTRIMFEKAKMLAREGKPVIFVLLEQIPSNPYLLFQSLKNEIENTDLEDNLKLMMSDEFTEIVEIVKNDINTNVFIDEYIYTPVFNNEFNSIIKTLNPESYLWVTVAKTWPLPHIPFQDWHDGMKNVYGFYLPNLPYGLRNPKEMIEFDKSLVEKTKDPSETVKSALILTSKNWPDSPLEIVTNQINGPKPIEMEHDTSISLNENIKICVDNFPASTKKILIIVPNFPRIPDELISAIHQARGKTAIVVDIYKESLDCYQKWLNVENEKDMIVPSKFVGGFEWPSVLVITDPINKRVIDVRDSVMRCLSRVVIFDSKIES